MAPHSNTVAQKIPWMEEPGRLQSMGSHRVGHDWSDLAAAAAPLRKCDKNINDYQNLFEAQDLQWFKINILYIEVDINLLSAI